jgi:type VI secretion system secreted protein Hcp
MAYEFYVTIEGTKQGKFKGESTRTAHKDKISGLGFGYEVLSPRDQATGQASGKRQHRPVKITKEWGAASPQIFQALVNNEVLKKVLFEFVRTTAEGKEEVHYTITLVNATISQLVQSISDTRHDSAIDKHELEDVSFTFQRIEIESKLGKTSAVDDWLIS